MSLYYACSTMHVKRNFSLFTLTCLLDHARLKSRMKKKMTPAQKAAQILSKLGASKGGKARAQQLSAGRRKAIAQKAAEARWSKKDKSGV